MAERLIGALRKVLTRGEPAPAGSAGLRPAAVLVPIYPIPDDTRVVLTRRTQRVEAHKGQVAFPGGAVEPSDADAVAAALRESREEIGLAPEHLEVLGQLAPRPTVSGFCITPVVGLIVRVPYAFRINPDEVAELFTVPLAWLLDPASQRRRRVNRPGEPPEEVFWEYQGRVIWGATARILGELVTLLRAELADGRR